MSPPLSVLVIGSGVIGATIGWELAVAGASVRVIDARRPGEGATRASAGVLAPYIEGHPDSMLRDLGRESLDLYDDFIARLRRDSGRDVLYERNGTLEVALTIEEAEALAAASASLWSLGVEARWVPPSVIPDVDPAVSRAATGALLVPSQGYVSATSLTNAAIAAAVFRGAELVVESGAVDIAPGSDGRLVVSGSSTRWEADRVVLAAGSWSAALTVQGADPVPVRPIRGQLLQMLLAGERLRHVIWGRAGYLVPWPDGSVLVGATVEDAGFDESPTEEGRRSLLAMAAGLVPALSHASVTDVRVGLRPRTIDDLPIIGPSAALPGLVYATAHYRNGVLLAPLTARLVRDMVMGSGAEIAAVAPARCGRL